MSERSGVMRKLLEMFLFTPVADDGNACARADRLLSLVLRRLALVIALTGAVVILVSEEKLLSAVYILAAEAAFLALDIARRRGQVRLASRALVVVMWIIVTLFALMAGGTHTVAAVPYIPFTVITALLLGWQAASVYAAVCVVSALIMAMIQTSGVIHLPQVFDVPPLSGWAILVFGLAISVGPVNMALRDLASALALAQSRLMERQRLAETLRESETQFRLIFESSRDAIGVAKAGIHVMANPAYLQMFGYESMAELEGVPILNLIAPGERARIEQYAAMRARGEPVPDEYVTRGLRKNGEEFDLEVKASVYTLKGERHTLVILRDISERRAAENAVRQSEALLRLVTDNMTDTITYVDAAGRLVYVSPSVSRVYGYEPQTLAEGGGFDLIHPDDRAQLLAAFETAKAGCDAPLRALCRYRHASGDYRWLELSINPVFDQTGYIGAVIASRDITDRRRAEAEVLRLNAELEQRVRERTAQLEEANQELEAFSYSVSHDLRAPLRSMDGFSRILLEEYGGRLDATAAHYLEVIRASAARMGNLIDDLLAFSRLSRQPLNRNRVDMAELVRQALASHEGELADRRVDIAIGPLPECRGDRALLLQVWMNLISNALKFTRKRAVATVAIGSYAGPQGETVYFVRDNGAGFDMRYADKLFAVFQRLHTVMEYEGTGVGLAIVKRIVNRHGGRIWAEARVDKGAAFYFTVPDAPSIPADPVV